MGDVGQLPDMLARERVDPGIVDVDDEAHPLALGEQDGHRQFGADRLAIGRAQVVRVLRDIRDLLRRHRPRHAAEDAHAQVLRVVAPDGAGIDRAPVVAAARGGHAHDGLARAVDAEQRDMLPVEDLDQRVGQAAAGALDVDAAVERAEHPQLAPVALLGRVVQRAEHRLHQRQLVEQRLMGLAVGIALAAEQGQDGDGALVRALPAGDASPHAGFQIHRAHLAADRLVGHVGPGRRAHHRIEVVDAAVVRFHEGALRVVELVPGGRHVLAEGRVVEDDLRFPMLAVRDDAGHQHQVVGQLAAQGLGHPRQQVRASGVAQRQFAQPVGQHLVLQAAEEPQRADHRAPRVHQRQAGDLDGDLAARVVQARQRDAIGAELAVASTACLFVEDAAGLAGEELVQAQVVDMGGAAHVQGGGIGVEHAVREVALDHGDPRAVEDRPLHLPQQRGRRGGRGPLVRGVVHEGLPGHRWPPVPSVNGPKATPIARAARLTT